MSEAENFGSFFKENKKLAKEYIDARLEIYRLQFIRLISKSGGYVLWIIIFFILFSSLIIFGGVTLSIWLSNLTGSYLKGFGITTLLIIAMITIITLLRRTIFINPIIRSIIQSTGDKEENDTDH